ETPATTTAATQADSSSMEAPAVQDDAKRVQAYSPAPVETAAAADTSPITLNGVAKSDDLKQVLESAGMHLVETKSAPAPDADTAPPVRLGRPRKSVAVPAGEPLQQVETH